MPDKFQIPKTQIIFLMVVIVAAFIFYAINLASMQIINFTEYERRAKEVASRETTILAQRGEIYDTSKDYPIVMNIPSFAVYATPGELDEEQKEVLKINLNEYLNISFNDLDRKIPADTTGSFQPVELKDALQYEQITYIAEHIEDFPGITWQSKPIRGYPEQGSISHVIGYVGNITSEEFQVLYNKGYDRNSTIGKSGIEKQYDMLLRGKDGSRMRMVDVKGRRIEEDAVIKPPENGNSLVISIDMDIQKLCEKALGDRIGSVVVMRPSTGEVLAMVSYPYYNPNLFYTDRSKEEYTKLSLDQRFPFLNRAIQSGYAPASTFKVIMTAAVLQEEAFPVDRTVTCHGSMTLGDRTFNCHKLSGHGPLTLAGGLAQSCNVFFYTMGVEYLGVDKIAAYSEDFGFGNYTGIDLPGESRGLVPTPAWKEDVYNTVWVGGDTMNISIGQGAMNVTPLQMASAISMIVNEGVAYKPHILTEVLDQTTGEVISEVQPEILHTSDISKDTFRTLKDYMRGVITDGTAKYVITTQAVDAAGKTGTGQAGYDEQWDSWFACFAPYETDNPEEQIVLVVNVEAVNEWEWWAPKASDMILQGIFADQTYEEVLEEFDRRWYLIDLRKRQQEAMEAELAESEAETSVEGLQ
ncbi:MAG: penicillin-binding protein 2 [Spirochaetales bacterium]|uniref:Penicillin-binding protein 2 n=1 Tax=Candidatus Thalassospirochaeta sargassi TaxID=3119039 RepID=A0AAJ1ICW2_9SPIO|nr:penicillin-binding protein 2 [Spirochaetales bacterium]